MYSLRALRINHFGLLLQNRKGEQRQCQGIWAGRLCRQEVDIHEVKGSKDGG